MFNRMETHSFSRKARELYHLWFPALTQEERYAFDAENAGINTRRIFYYSLFGIAISLGVMIFISVVFKEREIYREKAVYFHAVQYFHEIHLIILTAYIAIYQTIKRMSLSRERTTVSLKLLQYAALIAINLDFAYLVVMSQYYHSDLVFYAFTSMSISVAVYLRKEFRAFIFLMMAVIIIAGIWNVLTDNNLFIIKATNITIISLVCFVLSSTVYGFRLREFRNMRNLRRTNELLVNDLVHARNIQKHLIPAVPPQINSVTIYSLYMPMELVGGDFFDFITFREKGVVGVFISDVSGHGVPASLITSIIKTLIDTADDAKRHPGQLLHYINSRSAGLMAGNFITALYGIIDTKNMTFTYARGGHTQPLLMRNGKAEELSSSGKFIGVKNDLDFEERTIPLHPGDRILFYTDGLIEAVNAGGRYFEETLTREVLPRAAGMEKGNFVEYIYRELIAFAGHEEFDDDICMVGIELSRSPGKS